MRTINFNPNQYTTAYIHTDFFAANGNPATHIYAKPHIDAATDRDHYSHMDTATNAGQPLVLALEFC